MYTQTAELATRHPETAAGDLIDRFLADKPGAATRRAYAADLRDFFGGEPRPDQVSTFVGLPVLKLTLRLFTYKAELLARGASEATVNRRLSVVRSLLRYAHGLGLASSDGRGLVEGEKLRPTEEREPVDPATLKRLIAAPGTRTLRGRRDTAILSLLCENALARAELRALNVGDFSLNDRCLVLRQQAGAAPMESVPLSRRTAEAIAAYLESGGHAAAPAAPLFRSLDHRPAVRGERLTPDGLYFLVRQYGRSISVEDLTPHRLRKSAIAAALDSSNVSLRRVMSQRAAVSRELVGRPGERRRER
jgi:integrase/recombinase XerC